jgi:hypothetical protein
MLKRWKKRRQLRKELKRVRKERTRLLGLMTKFHETYRDEMSLLPDDLLAEYDEMGTRVLDLGLKIWDLNDELGRI